CDKYISSFINLMMEEMFNHSGALNRSSVLEDIDVSADGTPILRILISVVYSVVCAVGLVGNLLVFFLMRLRQGRKRSTINVFIINLAVTDFQFVLTLPFWAVDTALDFSWPFGDAMCKIVLSVTVMNMYASVFFLTAMSVTRYLAVASALKKKAHRRSRCVKWVCTVLWVAATVFPEGHDWLALYHIQKILIAFIIPMLIVSVNYLMLLRFVRQRSMDSSNPKRRSRVTKSVAIVVLSFFSNWDTSYYMVHTYVFPVTVCLAHANSCLNPVLYCLMRPEIRKMLSGLFWKASTPSSTKGCATRSLTQAETQGEAVPEESGEDHKRLQSPQP
uniref:Relaxin family peptide receptor 3.3a2 n=1 Tax=Neolamprologus brichardi TaxID=32507 RepID=A0A3Q4IAC2_NEOBR